MCKLSNASATLRPGPGQVHSDNITTPSAPLTPLTKVFFSPVEANLLATLLRISTSATRVCRMGEDAAFDSAAASTLVNDLRRVFRSGRTRPLQWREEQLKAIVRMFTEREADLVAALDKDLGKPVFETYLGDVSAMLSVAPQLLLLRFRLHTCSLALA